MANHCPIQILLFLAFTISISAQPEIGFSKTYGKSANEISSSMKLLPDGFILAGFTASSGAGSADYYLLKTNFIGDTIWTRTYGTSGLDIAKSVIPTLDRGFLVSGYNFSVSRNKYDYFVVRTDSVGNQLWSKNYNRGGNEFLYDALANADGTFWLVGYSQVSASSVWFLKIAANGDSLSSIILGPTGSSSYPCALIRTSDNGYLCSYWASNGKASVIKYDSLFNSIWQSEFGGLGNSYLYSLHETADTSSYVLGGVTNSFGNGGNDFWVLKLNKKGQQVWSKTYGTSSAEVLNQISPNTGGGYILGGFRTVGSDNNVWIVNIDAKGDTMWTKEMGGIGNDECTGIVQAPDGCYVGSGSQTKTLGQDVWIFKLNLFNITTPEVGGLSNNTILLPIKFWQPSDNSIISFQIKILGNHKKVKFLQVVTDSSLTGQAGWSVIETHNDTSINIVGAGSNNIYGKGNLFFLKVMLADSVYGDANLKFVSAIFNTGSLNTDKYESKIYIYKIFYGDVDLNNTVQAYDAAYILKYLVGSLNLTRQNLLNANVTSDTTVSALDASVVLKYLLGLIPQLPYDTTLVSMRASGLVSLNNGILVPGKSIEIPIYVTNLQNLFSYEGEFEYDGRYLNFIGFSPSGNAQNFTISSSERNGKIYFAAAGVNPVSGNGSIGKFKFMTSNVLPKNSVIVKLVKIRLNEGETKVNAAQAELSSVTGTNQGENALPKEFALEQNYPNPFNPITKIKYQIPTTSKVRLVVYDVLGNLVSILVDEIKDAGYYAIDFEAAKISSGMYFYRLESDGFRVVKKLIVLK